MESEAPFTVGTDVDVQSRVGPAVSGQNSAKHSVQVDANDQTPLLRGTGEASGYGESRLPNDGPDAPETDTKKSWRTANIFWMLPFLLLYMLGFGGTVVPKVNLILTLVCRDYFAEKSLQDSNFTYLPVLLGDDNTQCRVPEVQSLVARFQLYLNLMAGILSALASPRLGYLSDRYGRTRIIALGTLGAVLSEVITVIVAAKPESASVNLLFLGAIFDGLGGSYTTAVALVTSYASDCSRPDERNVAFGYFHGVLFGGIAAGPFLAAFLLKHGGRVLDIFSFALAFQTLYLLTVWLIVPESLPGTQQQIAREKHRIKREREDTTLLSRWNPMTLIAPLSILLPPVGRSSAFFPNRGGASRALQRNIVLLSTMDTATFGVALGTAQVVIIYAGYMFGWGNVESSIFVFIVNIVRVANLLLVLPIVTRVFRKPSTEDHAIMGSDTLDITLIRLSIVFDVLGYVGYALSRYGSVMILSGVVTALGGMGSPILQSSLTKHVPRDKIGQMLGAIGLLHALARITAPAFFSLIYSLTVGKFTQAVFVCLTGVFGLALLCSLFIRPHVYLDFDDVPSNGHDGVHGEGESENDALLHA